MKILLSKEKLLLLVLPIYPNSATLVQQLSYQKKSRKCDIFNGVMSEIGLANLKLFRCQENDRD